MQKIWFNLPVEDIQRSKTFYKKIGFKGHPMHEQAEHLAGFLIGEDEIVLMLFPKTAFEGFTRHKVSDTSTGTQVLFNLGAQSREEVDEMNERVRLAGGIIFAEPALVDGWMYVNGFMDPDGHRWSMLYMDMSKMPGRG